MKEVVLLDNYDSFTYNLVQYLQVLGAEVKVFRNDEISIEDLEKLRPRRLVISPGPGRPEDAGISKIAVRVLADRVPILGVCLGMQVIANGFGGKIVKAAPVHGKTASIFHDGRGIFSDIICPFKGMRYHSLMVSGEEWPAAELEVSAKTDTGLIMGLRHVRFPVEGVQFHPESILSEEGMHLLDNFLKL
jgi:anthranilate synthase/aminodeoxychorismate synthase-like glutamine amidotransferase